MRFTGGIVGSLVAMAAALGGLGNSAQVAAQSFKGVARFKPHRATRSRTPNKEPYTDSAGLSHGRPGDKLARKAAQGRIGVCHRPGPYNGLTIGRRTGKRANA